MSSMVLYKNPFVDLSKGLRKIISCVKPLKPLNQDFQYFSSLPVLHY